MTGRTCGSCNETIWGSDIHICPNVQRVEGIKEELKEIREVLEKILEQMKGTRG